MNDLISRQAAIDALYHVDEHNGRSVEAIRNLPSAQPYTEEEIQAMQELESAEIEKAYELGRESAQQERKKGKWVVYKAPDSDHCGMVECPFCGENMIAEPDEYNYCPDCGARLTE